MTSTPNSNFPSFINSSSGINTSTLTAVPASAPPIPNSSSVNYAETIKQIEQQIGYFGSGPHTPQQKEELNKLHILLQKTQQELQKVSNHVPTMMDNSPVVTAVAALSQSSPMSIVNSPSQVSLSGSPIVRPAAPYAPATPIVNPGSDGKVLDKRRLQELVKEVDPLEQLDDDVEEVLLQVADDFIENVVSSACQIAKHRKSNTLEVKDVQLYLERTWNMWLPGFGAEEVRPFKKACVTEAHKQRMALIRKTLKK